MRYRVRQRNALQARDSNALVTDPDTEIREQIQRTDTETTPPASGAAAVPGMGLTVNRAKRERVRTSYAYDGTYLRVPSVLHEELCRKSGPNSAALLHEFYAEEDEKLEREGKGTGDIFDFLRPRHQEWAIRKGVVEAAPTPMKRPKVAERAESRPPVTDRERAHAAEVRAQNEAQDAEQAQAIEAEYWRTHPAYAPKS
jgi:hypothetical protein